MLAFILALYCCIWCKACYIVRNKRGREPLSEKEEKRGGQRPRKSKRKEKKYKAEGLSKKNKESTKCLCMPKAFELKEKLRVAQSA